MRHEIIAVRLWERLHFCGLVLLSKVAYSQVSQNRSCVSYNTRHGTATLNEPLFLCNQCTHTKIYVPLAIELTHD